MPGTEGVHRLRDIVVEEVSLVDHAANKKRFLVVKREGDMSDLRPNGRGGFTRVAKGESPPEETEEEKAAKAAGKPFPGAAKPFGKPGEKPAPDDEAKAKAKKAAEEEEEKRAAAAKADAEGLELAKAVGEIATELTKLSESLEAEESSEPSDVHMKKMLATHKALGSMCDKYMAKVGKSAVAKVGAKMSAPRLTAFKAALDSLASIMAELLETSGSAAEHAAKAGDPTKGAVLAPPANGVGSAAIKQMNATLDTIAKGLETVMQAHAASKSQVATLSTELAALKKGIPGSTSISVQGRKVVAGDAVEWPMDMNGRGLDPAAESFRD